MDTSRNTESIKPSFCFYSSFYMIIVAVLFKVRVLSWKPWKSKEVSHSCKHFANKAASLKETIHYILWQESYIKEMMAKQTQQ